MLNKSIFKSEFGEFLKSIDGKRVIVKKYSKYISLYQRISKYFERGTSSVWMIDPNINMVKIFTSPKNNVIYSEIDAIPDLKITVNELFKNYN